MQPALRRRYLQALGLRDFLREATPVVADATQARATKATSPQLPTRDAGAARRTTPTPTPATTAPPAAASASVPASAAVEPPAVVAPVPKLDSLEAARQCVASCERCGLHGTRTQTVFGVGGANAPLMVVGEGPGAEEDRKGEPFVGRAGQLLDAMLAAIGHSRDGNTYIANVVKCRPPNNRDPQAEEVAACRPFLDAQIQLIQPRLILAVGRVAAQRLLDSPQPLAKLRGQIHHYGETQVPVWVSYHPAYLLRSPQEKAKAWQDLKRVHALLAQPNHGTSDGGSDGAGH